MPSPLETPPEREYGPQGPPKSGEVGNWMKAYRLRDGIRAVKLDSDGHGQFTMLPPGCIVQLAGTSSLRGFIEIFCDGERLNVFRDDLEHRGETVSETPPRPPEEDINL